jgi:leader peptidase (prepilin peptidase)/N-methyltransferase
VVTGDDAAVTAALTVVATLVGLAVGSFLNVVIARVPEGRSVVRPASACPACGEPIRPRDNVPVVSWLLLRGRARCCGVPISRRYPLVELLTGLGFGAVTAWQGPSWLLPALLYLVAVSVALTFIDLDVKRLPNQIVLPSYPVVAALLALASLGTGDWWPFARAVISGIALYGVYFVLMVIKPDGMGFGDVKLAFVLGMYLGYAGWGQVFFGTFAASLLGGLVGIGLILARRAGRKTEIPYGPYMIAGAWLGLTIGDEVVDWYLRLSGWR